MPHRPDASASAVAAARIPEDAPSGARCDPSLCPCVEGDCTLSRVARNAPGRHPDGLSTLHETEAAVATRLAGMRLDLPAMAAGSNLHRAAGAVRNHFERTVLAPHELTWTGFVVLWVAWIWEEIEARHLAAEAGISKGTLTGVARTLERSGALTRRSHPEDGRRVLFSLTPAGRSLMTELFPAFNAVEVEVFADLSDSELKVLASALRKVVLSIEAQDGATA